MNREDRKWKPLHLAIASIGIIVLIAVFLLTFPPPHVIASEKDFAAAKEKLDPEKVRYWAFEMIALHPPEGSSVDIPTNEIPAEIRIAFERSPGATVTTYNELKIVELHFGGGFAHWFIAVGPTNYSVPIVPGNGWVTKKWVPGIYFMREGNR